MALADPNIPLFKVFMAPPEELDGPLLQVIHSGKVTQGPKVEEFEAALREYFSHQHVLTLNSATSGLHLALHLLQKADGPNWPGLQPEVDEVLTCPLTCSATNWPILANRLRIKWVDADPKTSNMCLDDLEAKLSPTTKVIMIVHWGGVPANLDRIARIQQTCFQKFGFIPHVIEDCAHSMGAEHQGRKLGTHGNICVFSLQVRRHGRTQRTPPPPLSPPPPTTATTAAAAAAAAAATPAASKSGGTTVEPGQEPEEVEVAYPNPNPNPSPNPTLTLNLTLALPRWRWR